MQNLKKKKLSPKHLFWGHFESMCSTTSINQRRPWVWKEAPKQRQIQFTGHSSVDLEKESSQVRLEYEHIRLQRRHYREEEKI